jgi:hypothetical protein
MSDRLDFTADDGQAVLSLRHSSKRLNEAGARYRLRVRHNVLQSEEMVFLTRRQLESLHLAITSELAHNRSEAEARGFLRPGGKT